MTRRDILRGRLIEPAIVAVAATLLLLLAACAAPASPTSTPAPVSVETSVVPAGSGRIEVIPPPGKDGKYLQGTNLLVAAESSPGYQFVGWAGGASGAANPVSITVQSDLSIVASFAATAAVVAPAGTPTRVAVQAPTPTTGATLSAPAGATATAAAAATRTAAVGAPSPTTGPTPTPESVLTGVFGRALAPTPTLVPAQASTASLLGTWQCQVQSGQQQASAILVFESESSLLVNGRPISYALIPGGIRFGTDTLTLSVAGDSLVMTYQDGSRFQCQRAQLAGAGTAPTTGATQQTSLLGTWQCQASAGGQTVSAVLVFLSGSSLQLNNSQPTSYTLVPGGIRIDTDTYALSVVGDTLSMSQPQGISFQCQRAQPAGAGTAPTTGATQQTSLLGTWQCQVQLGGQTGSLVFVFESESRMMVNGKPFSYTLIPGGIQLGTDTYTVALSGDSLVMTYKDGSRFDCKRTQSAATGTSSSGASTTGNEWMLQGSFCSWSGSSTSTYGGSQSYSSSTRGWFDGKGRFTQGSESSYSGGTTGPTAGDLAYNNSPTNSGTYRIVGDNVYLTFGDGSTITVTVNYRWTDGSITELKYGDTLYSPQLCG